MTNEELLRLIDQVRGGTANPPTTKIDKTIPLPVGTKTITGFLGALVTGAASVAMSNPEVLNFATDWKSAVATGIALAFTALAGAGGIAKWQRQILLSQQAVEVLQQVLRKLQEQAQAQGPRE